jgi:hypothetical protein
MIKHYSIKIKDQTRAKQSNTKATPKQHQATPSNAKQH